MKRVNAIYFFLVFFTFLSGQIESHDLSLSIDAFHKSSLTFISVNSVPLVADRDLQEEHPDKDRPEKKQFIRENLPEDLEKDDEDSVQQTPPIKSTRAKRVYREYIERLHYDPCNPKVLGVLLKVAKVWHNQKAHWPKVLKIYKAYLRCNPKNTDVGFKKGQVELWMGKTKEAEKTLKQVIEKSPRNTDAVSLLVKAYTRQRKWEEANRLLDAYPNLPDSEKDRAAVAMGQRNFKSAESHYERVLSKNPKDLAGVRGLAGALASQKKFKESKPYYKKLTELEPRNQRNWNQYGGIRSYTNPSILMDGSYTQSRENDPDLLAPVVADFYTLGSYTVFVPIFNRWKLSAKQIYFHHKQDDIFPPMGINYNVYIWGAQINSEVLISNNFKWDLNFRYLGARGYNNNVFFPFNSKSVFEPGTSIIYSSPLQLFVINSHVESFIIKNFQRRITQLLRTIYIHAGYALKPRVPLEPKIEVLFDEVFYHDRLRNRRNTLYLLGQFNLIKSYLRFIYEFRQANFRDLTDDYYTFRRQLRNTIGGVIEFKIKDRFHFKCTYEHWWKYTAGLVQPIGIFVFVDNRQRLQGERVSVNLGYQIRDKLKVEALGHLQYDSLPYRDYKVGGRILWQF